MNPPNGPPVALRDAARFREAVAADLDAVVALLHDDVLGQGREDVADVDSAAYAAAFAELCDSKYFGVFVMEVSGDVVGCYQMMFLPHLSFKGTMRAQVESVRVRSDLRGQGLGTRLVQHAIETAREAGCGIFQLTSNKERLEANKFYRALGLDATHDGYKLYFTSSD